MPSKQRFNAEQLSTFKAASATYKPELRGITAEECVPVNRLMGGLVDDLIDTRRDLAKATALLSEWLAAKGAENV